MSKEKIKALISAKIAGQGSMVDVGGALPTILDAILDIIPEGGGGVAPLVVEGTIDGTAFTPNTGQPTYKDALNVYSNGGVVILSFDDSGEDYIEHVISGTAELRTLNKIWTP